MAFSYSSGVITQTGTDTDLSGLNGLTGVTRIGYVTINNQSYYIYDIGTNRLDIEGNLTINPEYNMLLTNCPTGLIPNMSINVRGTGVLTLGVKTVVGDAIKYTTGTAIIATEQGSLNTNGSLHVESGGTLNSYGALIELSGPTRILAGATLTVEDLTVVNARSNSCQFRIEASSVADVAKVSITENGITLNGKSSNDSCRLTTSGNINPFDSNSFIFNFVRAQYQPAASGYPPQVFLNFDNGNNVDSADFAYAGSGGTGGTQFDGDLVDFRNVARRLRYTNANTQGGFCKTTKNVSFELQDADGNGLSTIAYYAVDVDNGARINFNGFDSTADIVYSGQNAGPTLSLTPVVEYMAGENTTQYVDSRTNGDDTIRFQFISYNTNITSSSPVLIGLGDLESVIVNATDASITESNKATVDAYTELETPQKFYDRAKSHLCDNYAGEANITVSRSGDVIDAGAYDVTIDATAVSAYDLTGNLITIKASTFTGDINTTGTFTLANGAVLDGVLNGQLEVQDGVTYTEDINGKFVVDTDTVSTFTIDGFIPTEIEHTGSGSSTILGINNAKLVGTTITATGGTLVLGDGLNPSTNWTESAGLITLTTGTTEADLDGLRGLEFVDYQTIGTSRVFTILGRIVINGTLSIDPEKEQLLFSDEATFPNLQVTASGTLTVGEQQIIGGDEVYPQGLWMRTTKQASSAFVAEASLYVANGATVTLSGGDIDVSASVYLYGQPIVNSATIILRETLNQVARVRTYNTGGIDNAEIINNGIEVNGGGTINNVKIINASTFGLHAASVSVGDPFVIYGYDYEASGSLYPWLEANWICKNSIKGSSIPKSIGGLTGSEESIVRHTQDITFSLSDLDSSPVEGAKMYARDYTNGETATIRGVDLSAQNIYTGVSDVNGEVSITDYFLSATYRIGTNTIVDNFRNQANDNSDTHSFVFIAYGFQISQINNLSLRSATSILYAQTLLPDTQFTELTKATVDAYTEIETPQKFYDRAFAHLLDNHNGETATLVTRSGTEIDAGSYNVTIDATAVSAFAFDGSTITIKATVFTGDLTTTGTITLLNGASILGTYTDSSGTTSNFILTLNTLVVGSQVVIFEAGTTTELYRTNSSGTTEAVSLNAGTYDYTVMKAGHRPIRVTEVVISNSSISANITQDVDRAYVASSGLTYGTTATLTGTTFAVTTATTVQNWYSAWIEFWITQSALANKTFPLSTFGPNSISLGQDHEFTAGSIQYLSRDGFRYVDSGGAVTARYAAILSQGVTAGLQARYEQVDGGTITNAQNTGNVDQVIQIFGDATHGNFDYTGTLDFKVQANGYRQAEADVVATFGTLEEQQYIIALSTSAITGLTLGDPSPTGLTLTDDSAAPVSWDAGDGAKNYSITITDTGSNSGETILRWLNYNLAQSGSFQGLSTFDWPEMVLDNGAAYETLRGVLHKSGGDVLAGVRVVYGDNTPHIDFTRFQADDGTYGTPPNKTTVSAANIIDGARYLRFINGVAAGAQVQVSGGSGISETLTEGVDYTAGQTIAYWVSYVSGTSAKMEALMSGVLPSGGGSITFIDTLQDCPVYNTNAIDGSLVSGYVHDDAGDEIDITVAPNWSIKEMYAWVRYQVYSNREAMIDFFQEMTGEDVGNYKLDDSRATIRIDNTNAAKAKETTGARLYTATGDGDPIKNPTTNGPIDLNWREPVLVAQDADIDAIKATVDANLDVAVSTRSTDAGVWAKDLSGDTAGNRLRKAQLNTNTQLGL